MSTSGSDKPPPYTPYPPESFNDKFIPSAPYNPYVVHPPPSYHPYPVQTAPNYGSMLDEQIPVFAPQDETIESPDTSKTNDFILFDRCPACRVGVLEDDYPCLAIFCAIALFPFGLICCLALKDKRCPNCGANFG